MPLRDVWMVVGKTDNQLFHESQKLFFFVVGDAVALRLTYVRGLYRIAI